MRAVGSGGFAARQSGRPVTWSSGSRRVGGPTSRSSPLPTASEAGSSAAALTGRKRPGAITSRPQMASPRSWR
eukprot:362520-Alexandrium_andersonii.AAC.1